MINGLDIYYSKNIGRGLKPVSPKNKKQLLVLNQLVKKVHVKNMEKD